MKHSLNKQNIHLNGASGGRTFCLTSSDTLGSRQAANTQLQQIVAVVN